MEPIEPVEPAGQPPIDDGVERSLDPAVITVDRLGGFVSTVVLGGVALLSVPIAGLAGVWGPLWYALLAAAVVLIALLAASAWALPPVRWRHASYRLDGRGMRVRRGVWFRSEIDVPRSRVQHTDVSQGPIERAYGIATLILHTAGTEHSQVAVRGLPREVALRLRDALLDVGDDDAV